MSQRQSTSELMPCNLCGGLEYKKSVRGSDLRLGIPTQYQVYECCACGLACLQPQPDRDSFPAHYPDQLWEAEFNTLQTPQRLSVTLNLLQRGHPHPGTLLDVGCATGEFVLMAKRAGWQAQGIEVNERQVQLGQSRGADVSLCPDFLAYPLDAQFDAITFNHVLEHLASPRAYLDKTFHLLRSDGTLVVSVPNYDSLSRKLFGQYWTHLDIPRHLFHFTPSTLKRLVESVGFRVLDIAFEGREDDSLGVRDSIRRWIRYRILRRSLGIPMRPRDYRTEKQPAGFSQLWRLPYRAFSDATANLMEKLCLADTFALVASLAR